MAQIDTDICIIGAGSAGLSVAAGAAQMGARTVLIEKGEMGGDCLNYGCVPSKSLLAAGRAAQTIRDAGRFGVTAGAPKVDFQKVHSHVHGVIAAIAPVDSQERFEGFGCTVLRVPARFVGPREVEAGADRIRSKWFVIATGSTPSVPPITGLAEVPYFTNETLFANADLPRHLIIIGGGPIGLEMAQAHRRLGAQVTVLEALTVLAKDDPELAGVVRNRLAHEGVTIHEGVTVTGVEAAGAGAITANFAGSDGRAQRVEGSHLLVAAGRRPSVDQLNLEAAGVRYSSKGIEVDARLRTSNRRIFAIGDVSGGPQFTHVAGYHAGVVIKNALFRIPAKVDYRALPWVTYTDPELANTGLTEEAARTRFGDRVRVLRWRFDENDRAQTMRDTEGLAKVIAGPGGRVLGAGIVGAEAGELIQPWVLAIGNRLKIGKMAQYVAPYPTLGEVGKRAAGSYYTPSLFSDRTRRIVRFLLRFA